ncbi:transcription antitermination factor NusB [Porphyromonadaceae bacterium]
MINRILIRTKILQILFAFYQNEDKGYAAAEKELFFSIEKAYDLYFLLLRLGVEITYLHEKRIDIAKNKFLPTEQELNPNLRLVNNRLIRGLASCSELQKRCENNGLNWSNQELLVRALLDEIVASDLYKEYLLSDDTFESDRAFWSKVYKQLIPKSDHLLETLEEMSVYWNDDFDTIVSFAQKTIKKYDEKDPGEVLFPMFKSDEDFDFAKKLFRSAYLNGKEYRSLIETHIKNWDIDRLAYMDLLIIQIAIAELMNFPSIPATVTINEYIEIAKCYSTERSGTFVNGILDKVVNELRAEKKILK